MSLQVIIPPTAEPVNAAEVLVHSRIDSADGQELARSKAAREHVENLTWRSLVLQTLEERYDFWCPVFRLSRAPVREVVSIKYLDSSGDLQTLDTSIYQVDLESEPARISLAFGKTWPVLRGGDMGAVRIQYRAGYAVPFTSVAATDIVTAMDHWFADADAMWVWSTLGASDALPTGLSVGLVFARDVSGDTLKLAVTSGGAAIDITADDTAGTHFLGEIPESFLSAIRMLAGEMNERREQAVSGSILTPNVVAAQNLVMPYKVPG